MCERCRRERPREWAEECRQITSVMLLAERWPDVAELQEREEEMLAVYVARWGRAGLVNDPA